MDFPTPDRLPKLASELERRHTDTYMVWNVAGSSTSQYDTTLFGGRVVALRFVGYLCPPLMMLMEACASIHNWLKADNANVVAIHCRSGRGRSAVLLSCVLAWRAAHGGDGSTNPLEWLSHLSQLRGEDESTITLPSHRRYLHYVAEILGGLRPSSCGRLLQTVVLHCLPEMPTPPDVELHAGTELLYRSDSSKVLVLPPTASQPPDVRSYMYEQAEDSQLVLREDVVLSVREAFGEKRLLFRAAFHPDLTPSLRLQLTQLVPRRGNLLRLPADALDGMWCVP